MKIFLILILFVIAISVKSQTADLKQEGATILWEVKGSTDEVTRELVNLDNKLRERQDFEQGGTWFAEKLYRGKWIIRIFIKDKLIFQKEFEVK